MLPRSCGEGLRISTALESAHERIQSGTILSNANLLPQLHFLHGQLQFEHDYRLP